MTTQLDPSIFKAYDIRGIYGEQIDGDVAELIGRGFAQVLSKLSGKPQQELRVGLGRDMRLSAPELAARYKEGLLQAGADVIDAGEVGTEMLYYLVGSRQLDGGLMCTASHNPKAYTGAKLVREGALALSGDEGIQDIRRAIEDGFEAGADAPVRGVAAEIDLYREFQAAALKFIDPSQVKPLKVVLDGGNGMAGPMVGPILAQLGLDLIETYWTPDGEFPDHEPNPLLPENRELVIAKVRESGADLGIAWDGDADRCFFIDEQGEFVDGDFLTALLAEALLAKNPNPTHPEAILYDVRASWAVPDTVKRAGGTPYVNRVGHAFFKGRMRREGSLFGGEVSGHYYFRDFYCADSGTLPALLILEHLSRSGKTMSQLLAPYRERYFISGEINSEVEDQQAKMQEIAERYADAKQETLDGISIDYEDWHFNVRPSNTEPLLRLCLESLVSRQDMERRRDEVLGTDPLLSERAGNDRTQAAGGAGIEAKPSEAEEREQAQRALEQAAAAGIHRIAVPTPFRVGRVNAYLIEDDPLTLIDSGPNSQKSLAELEHGLAALGHRVQELQLLVITHQHIDHFGLAATLAKRSRAEVVALAALGPYLERFTDEVERDDAFAQALMLRHGVPEDVAGTLRAVTASFRGWGANVHVDRGLVDGERLRLRDRELQALHRPGHSPSDTVFLDQQQQIMLTGDHLIKHISSNPLISRPLGSGEDEIPLDPRPHALIAYIDSLQRTQAMDLRLALPGHGDPVTDHESLIAERLRLHERRKNRIAKLIDERPRTAHEIAHAIWGEVAVTQAFLTLSEVLGHADLLLQEDAIVEVEQDGVVHFHPAS